MKHTPGPWEVKREFNVMDCRGRNIAACGGFMTNVNPEDVHAEKIANAHLIAAAPDMYEALNHLLAFRDSIVPDSVFEMAEEALKKAGGGRGMSDKVMEGMYIRFEKDIRVSLRCYHCSAPLVFSFKEEYDEYLFYVRPCGNCGELKLR